MEQSTKLLGGISYVVLIVFAILGGFRGPISIVSLAAAICVMIAFIRAGGEVGRPDVKNDIIVAIVLYIVAMILLIFVFGMGVAAMLAVGTTGFAPLGAGAVIAGLVGWILSIVAAWFWFKASRALTQATGEKLFKIGGLLLFIGAILLIVFGIGGIIMLIGEILQCIAFFTVHEKGPLARNTTPETPAD